MGRVAGIAQLLSFMKASRRRIRRKSGLSIIFQEEASICRFDSSMRIELPSNLTRLRQELRSRRFSAWRLKTAVSRLWFAVLKPGNVAGSRASDTRDMTIRLASQADREMMKAALECRVFNQTPPGQLSIAAATTCGGSPEEPAPCRFFRFREADRKVWKGQYWTLGGRPLGTHQDNRLLPGVAGLLCGMRT